jgi:hypothetical protein
LRRCGKIGSLDVPFTRDSVSSPIRTLCCRFIFAAVFGMILRVRFVDAVGQSDSLLACLTSAYRGLGSFANPTLTCEPPLSRISILPLFIVDPLLTKEEEGEGGDESIDLVNIRIYHKQTRPQMFIALKPCAHAVINISTRCLDLCAWTRTASCVLSVIEHI